jgi:hypothetical protein
MTATNADDGEIDVVLHGEPAEEPRLLVRPRQSPLRARAGGHRRHVPSEELHGTGGHGEVAADEVEESGLPCSVRAEDGAPLTVRDVEVDAADGEQAAEPPADPPQAEGRLSVFGCCCFRQTAT